MMSEIQKTIHMLQEIPEEFSTKISMRQLSEIFSIMFSLSDDVNFEPTIEDFMEAVYINLRIKESLSDVKNGKTYTSDELKKELGI